MTNRKTTQIANSIQLFAGIPAGDALVQVLGRGDEKTNIEALGHWVEEAKIKTSHYYNRQLSNTMADTSSTNKYKCL